MWDTNLYWKVLNNSVVTVASHFVLVGERCKSNLFFVYNLSHFVVKRFIRMRFSCRPTSQTHMKRLPIIADQGKRLVPYEGD